MIKALKYRSKNEKLLQNCYSYMTKNSFLTNYLVFKRRNTKIRLKLEKISICNKLANEVKD